MNSVFVIEIKDFDSNKEILHLNSLLSKEKQIRVEKFLKKEDIYRCILGELLLRYSLWNFYDYKVKNIKFLYNEFGKPRLYYTDNQNIHFNISHSGNWIVCGISNQPIGIDVECINNNVSDIAQRFFTNAENNYIKTQIPTEQAKAFFKIWTLKESYIKCVGKGLTIPLNSFSIIITEDEVLLYKNNKVDYSYSFISKKISNFSYLGLCIKNSDMAVCNVKINYITIQQILNWVYNNLEL